MHVPEAIDPLGGGCATGLNPGCEVAAGAHRPDQVERRLEKAKSDHRLLATDEGRMCATLGMARQANRRPTERAVIQVGVPSFSAVLGSEVGEQFRELVEDGIRLTDRCRRIRGAALDHTGPERLEAAFVWVRLTRGPALRRFRIAQTHRVESVGGGLLDDQGCFGWSREESAQKDAQLVPGRRRWVKGHEVGGQVRAGGWIDVLRGDEGSPRSDILTQRTGPWGPRAGEKDSADQQADTCSGR